MIYLNKINHEREIFFTSSDRDWPEDFYLENGNYLNKCLYCEQNFLGHKRRIVCRKCQLNSPVDIP